MGKVRDAIFQMPPSKAPGHDGKPASFFQQFWPEVGADILEAIKSFFPSGNLLRGMNRSIKANMTQLRPISLCNVAYKILAKVLGNRLAGVLPFIISETQGAFCSGQANRG